MLLDNEFLSAEQISCLHLKNIIAQRRSPNNNLVQRFQNSALQSVISLMETGLCCISQKCQKVQDLIDKPQKLESQIQREEKKRKLETKAIKNSLLFSSNKNQQIQTQQIQKYGVLSNTQHLRFVNQMKHQNSLRKINREKVLHTQNKDLQIQLSTERQLSEASRLLQLQKKKEVIQESLRKMRQNHEFFVRQEQQSKKMFNKIKRKKRLYEQMKETYEEIAFELINQREQKAKKDRKELNKLDLSEIKIHEKEYEEWKKRQLKEAQKYRQPKDSSVQIPPFYQPPAHSQKIQRFLNQQIKNKNKVEISKRVATEKLQRIAYYTSIVREKFKPKSLAGRTEPTEKSSASQAVENKKSHTELGNNYLKQAKLITRKRAKTQERSLNPQKIDSQRSRQDKDKSRTSTLNYVPETKRKEHIQKMKRAEIENILKGGCSSQAERLRKLKLADERLSRELKKKQQQMKIRYSAQNSENTLALLLGTIRAKMSLIDCYRNSK